MPLVRAFTLEGICPTSPDFRLEVGGQAVWVESHGEIALARCAVEGPVRVVLHPARRVDALDLRPRSRRIRADWTWNRVEFTLPGPGSLWLELPGHPPLLIVALPARYAGPAPAGARVFGPGEHVIERLELASDQTVWVDGDAIIRGGITGSPQRARLLGAGVIDAGALERPRKVMELVDATDTQVEGVTLRAGPCWQNAVLRCRQVTLRHATVISHGRNGDGIDVVASSDITIEDCFFRCTDDCISLKCNVDPRFMPPGVEIRSGTVERVNVRRCTMVGWNFADGFTIGFEARGERVADITVEDCDILYARGHSCANGHSAFSVICDGPATVERVRFARLRVEEDVFKNFELFVTHGGYYVQDGPGRIRDITVEEVDWAADRPIELRGHAPGHGISGVRFVRCRVAGRPLDGAEAADLRLHGPVEGVEFT